MYTIELRLTREDLEGGRTAPPPPPLKIFPNAIFYHDIV